MSNIKVEDCENLALKLFVGNSSGIYDDLSMEEILQIDRSKLKYDTYEFSQVNRLNNNTHKIPVEAFFFFLRKGKIKEFKMLLLIINNNDSTLSPKERKKFFISEYNNLCGYKDNRSARKRLDWLVQNRIITPDFKFNNWNYVSENERFASKSSVMDFVISDATLEMVEEISICVVERYLISRYLMKYKSMMMEGFNISSEMVDGLLSEKRKSKSVTTKGRKHSEIIRIVDNHINDYGYSFTFLADVLGKSVDYVFNLMKNAEEKNLFETKKTNLVFDRLEATRRKIYNMRKPKMRRGFHVPQSDKQRKYMQDLSQMIEGKSEMVEVGKLKNMRIYNIDFNFQYDESLDYESELNSTIWEEINKSVEKYPDSKLAKDLEEQSKNGVYDVDKISFIRDSDYIKVRRDRIHFQNDNLQIMDFYYAGNDIVDKETKLTARKLIDWFVGLELHELYEMGWFKFEKEKMDTERNYLEQDVVKNFLIKMYKHYKK